MNQIYCEYCGSELNRGKCPFCATQEPTTVNIPIQSNTMKTMQQSVLSSSEMLQARRLHTQELKERREVNRLEEKKLKRNAFLKGFGWLYLAGFIALIVSSIFFPNWVNEEDLNMPQMMVMQVVMWGSLIFGITRVVRKYKKAKAAGQAKLEAFEKKW